MKTTRVFAELLKGYQSGARYLDSEGGTRSGKTYACLQLLILLATYDTRPTITSVVSESLPHLKRGAIRDFREIMTGEGLWDDARWNDTDKVYTFPGGSIVEFFGVDSAAKVHGPKRWRLFINEAQNISYDVARQLFVRTMGVVFIDYNPSARFWVHDNIIGRDDARLIISDHRANCFLTEEEHEKIEGIEDRQLFRVYARGLTGRITGLVYTNWDVVDGLPDLAECKLRCYGLDFGFTNDPTALVEVRLAHGELWVDEVIYSTGMTNPDIAGECKRNGIGRESVIIADSAEPKSVAELNACGLNVVLATKGKDSVVNGIDILRRYPMHFTRRSRGLIGEAEHYTWRAARDGAMTNVPVDAYNHALDALRYVAINMLGRKRRGNARAHTIEI